MCGCDKLRGLIELVQGSSQAKFEAVGLTLNVDMAGSLLYLSMVWNLEEWLSSWYSSECLLRVCITFWKGRKEGDTKKNEPKRKQNKWKGEQSGVGKMGLRWGGGGLVEERVRYKAKGTIAMLFIGGIEDGRLLAG